MKNTTLYVVAMTVLAFVAAGCGGKNSGSSEQGSNLPAPTASVDPATAGSISGIVKLDGKPPVLRPINVSAEPFCEKSHPSPVLSQEVVLGNGGALANVVVYVKGHDLDRYAYPVPSQRVELDQRGCMYEPHVVALRTGQELEVKNDDQTTHNVHALPENNPEWNKSQPPGAGPIEQTFAHPELAIPIRCNVHPWMKAYIFVFKTPYYAVTAKDGKFQIGDLPPGTYTIEAWQEKYGTQDRTVTIAPKESKQVSFAFKVASASE